MVVHCRLVIEGLASNHPITQVPVAAILAASRRPGGQPASVIGDIVVLMYLLIFTLMEQVQ